MRRILLPLMFVALVLCLGLSLIANAALAWGWRLADAGMAQAQAQMGALQATAHARSTTIANLQAQVEAQRREMDELHRRLATAPVAQTPRATPTSPATAAPPPPSATPMPPATPTFDLSLMDTIQRQVSALRGLKPKRPVERTVLTQAELRDFILTKLAEDYPQEEARNDAVTLSAFGLIDPQMDLYDFYVDLYSEQIAGFYDSEEEKLYVISDLARFGPIEKTTFAHEYEHALQDQYYDLDNLGLDDQADSQRSEAIRALAEGDAVLLMQQYVQAHFGPQDLAELLRQLGQADQSQFANAPPVFQQELQFPYTYGLQFVQDFYDQGGWTAVDEVWADPPVSTEQILHPDRYRAGDAPRPVTLSPLTDTLGSGWRLIEEDTLGEFLLRVVLEAEIAAPDAADAAEGWGGDRYAVYHNARQSQTLLALHLVWDTNADATEFVAAYAQYAQARLDRPAHEQRTERSLRRCWSAAPGGAQSLCLLSTARDRPEHVLIVLGPNMDMINAVIAQFPDY